MNKIIGLVVCLMLSLPAAYADDIEKFNTHLKATTETLKKELSGIISFEASSDEELKKFEDLPYSQKEYLSEAMNSLYRSIKYLQKYEEASKQNNSH